VTAFHQLSSHECDVGSRPAEGDQADETEKKRNLTCARRALLRISHRLPATPIEKDESVERSQTHWQ